MLRRKVKVGNHRDVRIVLLMDPLIGRAIQDITRGEKNETHNSPVWSKKS